MLSVNPEESQINLRFATQVPPEPGQTLFVYPPRYLEALRALWKDESWSARCTRWVDEHLRTNRFDRDAALAPVGVPRSLRASQALAFNLTGWDVSFLWGPPGTGKTYTLGAMLAAYLLQRPHARVLLLSTTNSAIDQALVSVDRSLEAYGQRGAVAFPWRVLRGVRRGQSSEVPCRKDH